MKAVRFHEHGGPEVLKCKDARDLAPEVAGQGPLCTRPQFEARMDRLRRLP